MDRFAMLLHSSYGPAYITTLLTGAVTACTNERIVICFQALDRLCIRIWIYDVLGGSGDGVA
jgi:hypothetical protein